MPTQALPSPSAAEAGAAATVTSSQPPSHPLSSSTGPPASARIEQRHEPCDLSCVHRHLEQLHELAHRPDAGLPSLTSIDIPPPSPSPSPSHRHRLSRRAQAWATALIVFSGPGHDADLAARLRARGFHVTVFDTADGGYRHDVLRDGLGDHIEARILRGDFDVVFLATPCSSYSVAHRPRLRARRSPMSSEAILARHPSWRRYVGKHNALCTLTARLIMAAHRAKVAWALENPADRGDRLSPAWWPKHADHAPIFITEPIADATTATGASTRTFAQCSFGADVQKWTSILHAVSPSVIAPHPSPIHLHPPHDRRASQPAHPSPPAHHPPPITPHPSLITHHPSPIAAGIARPRARRSRPSRLPPRHGSTREP